MRQFARRLTAALLFCLLATANLVAQEAEPAWLKVERADRFASDGEFGRAIQLYREALDAKPNNPDALLGLGRAFTSAGDYIVAERYLKQARAQSAGFAVPDRIYDVLYSLAQLYEVQRRFAELESILTDAVNLADAVPTARNEVRPDGPVLARSLEQDGLDRLLLLYRRREDGATQARGELCELFVGLGRYDTAAQHGLTAVLQQLTTILDAIMARDPLYEYRTVRDAIERAGLYPETREYLARTTLYRNLYYLAAAEYSAGRRGSARRLWTLLAELPGAGRSATQARVQLADPRDEPLLVPPR